MRATFNLLLNDRYDYVRKSCQKSSIRHSPQWRSPTADPRINSEREHRNQNHYQQRIHGLHLLSSDRWTEPFEGRHRLSLFDPGRVGLVKQGPEYWNQCKDEENGTHRASGANFSFAVALPCCLPKAIVEFKFSQEAQEND